MKTKYPVLPFCKSHTAITAMGAIAVMLAGGSNALSQGTIAYDSFSGLQSNADQTRYLVAEASTPVGGSFAYQMLTGVSTGYLSLTTFSFGAAGATALYSGSLNVFISVAELQPNRHMTPLSTHTFGPGSYSISMLPLGPTVNSDLPARFDFDGSSISSLNNIPLNGYPVYIGVSFGIRNQGFFSALQVNGAADGYVTTYNGTANGINLLPGGIASMFNGAVSVPEPASLTLCSLGIAGYLMLGMKRNKTEILTGGERASAVYPKVFSN